MLELADPQRLAQHKLFELLGRESSERAGHLIAYLRAIRIAASERRVRISLQLSMHDMAVQDDAAPRPWTPNMSMLRHKRCEGIARSRGGDTHRHEGTALLA